MARGSLPAVLLLLLGFVEAVDIKGENSMIFIIKHTFHHLCQSRKLSSMFFSSFCWCTSPFFLGLDFFSLATKDVFFKVQGIPFAKSFPVLPFLSLNDSSQLRCTKKTSGDEISQQKPFSSTIFQFFLHFFNSSHVGCRKASADKILDKQPAPCVAFSRRTLFINPPATDNPHPAILVRLKTIRNFQFFTSGPMSRTDQIVVTGLNDAWGPNYYFAVKLRQSLWLDIQRGAHENS